MTIKQIQEQIGRKLTTIKQIVTRDHLQPTYKRVMTMLPHCPICGEKLMGDNSIIHPWKCSCGVWKVVMTEGGNWHYKIVEDK